MANKSIGFPALCVLMLTLLSQSISSTKILIYPVGHCYNSFLLDMEILASFLTSNKYDVSFLINDNYTGSKSDIDLNRVVLKTFPRPRDPVTVCDFDTTFANGNISLIKLAEVWMESTLQFCNSLLHSGILNQLRDENYDLLIIDRTDWCSAFVAHHLQIPFITFASVSVPFNTNELQRDIQVPNIFMASLYPFDSASRYINTALQLAILLFFRPITLAPLQQLKETHNIYQDVDLTEVYDKAYVNFINRDSLVEYPRPSYSHEVNVGFLFTEVSSRILPEKFSKFMEDSNDVIVISFGSRIVKLNEDTVSAILELASNVSSKIVWRSHVQTDLPNLLTSPWVPQNALMASGRVKLLITHGGLASSTEAIYFGIPMIVIPMSGEQQAQALKLSSYLKVATTLEMQDVSAKTLSDNIHQMLSSHHPCRSAVKQLSYQAQNKPVSTKDQTLYWIDRIVCNKAARPARPASEVSLNQWLLVDFITINFIIFVLVSCLLCKILKTLSQKFIAFNEKLVACLVGSF